MPDHFCQATEGTPDNLTQHRPTQFNLQFDKYTVWVRATRGDIHVLMYTVKKWELDIHKWRSKSSSSSVSWRANFKWPGQVARKTLPLIFCINRTAMWLFNYLLFATTHPSVLALFKTYSERKHPWESFRLRQRPLLSITLGVYEAMHEASLKIYE